MKPTWHNLLRLAYSTTRDKSLGQRAEVLSELISPKTPVAKITNATVLQVLEALRAKGLSGATINRYLSILSKVATVYRKHFDPAYTLFVPWQAEGSGRFEWLRKADEAKLLEHLEAKGQTDLALIVSILTTTGMRLGELMSLEPSQVEDSWIRLWVTKTNRPRSCPIPDGLGSSLRALIEKGLLPRHQIARGLRGALRACGINSNITPHSLRHTTATRLIKGGVNVLVTQKYMGHNSIKTTQRYVHIDDQDIVQAMQAVSANTN